VVLLDLFTLYYVVTLAIKLIIGCFIKFHGNGQILRLSSKFHGTQKTVGPIHYEFFPVLYQQAVKMGSR